MLPLGLQLYAVRDAIDEDFEGTIHRVADMGYMGVETAFFPESVTYSQAGQLFTDLGLTVLGVHCEVPSDDETKDDILAMAEAYQCKRMVWHGWPHEDRYHSPADTKRWAEIYNEASAFCQQHGLRFGLL